MTMQDHKPIVELILDLRRFSEPADTIGKVEDLWKQVSHNLIGKSIADTNTISLDFPAGNISYWIVDSNGITQIMDDTEFRIVDVLRSPKLLYQCIVCGQYGPLRCIKCEEDGRETRLCSKHAHIIKDELSAYCPDHIPMCNCKDGCQEQATFRCRSCARTNRKHSLYGDHFHKNHPKDREVDYCYRCFQWKFEHCQAPGCHRIGRSKCNYQTRNMEEPCNIPACSDHSYQWKIWGPHNRGVALCEKHHGFLGITDPADLIFLIITAKAPFARRGRLCSMPNPFRLRRLINRHRTSPMSFIQLESALKSLQPIIPNWGRNAERNYTYLMKLFTETMGNLDGLELDLLDKIRSFYQSTVSWDSAQQIQGLQIQDKFSKPGEKPKYRVKLIVTGEKGRLIGRAGIYANALRNSLNVEVDFD